MHEESLHASEIRGKAWKNVQVEVSIPIHKQDADFFSRKDLTHDDIDAHLAFMTSEAKRHTEVRISHLSTTDREKFEKAKDAELKREREVAERISRAEASARDDRQGRKDALHRPLAAR